MANSIYEKYLKYLVHCCCHLEALGLVGQKPLISHMVEKGKYAYLVVISDILMFYGLYLSHMSRFYGNWLRVGGEISIRNFEIF